MSVLKVLGKCIIAGAGVYGAYAGLRDGYYHITKLTRVREHLSRVAEQIELKKSENEKLAAPENIIYHSTICSIIYFVRLELIAKHGSANVPNIEFRPTVNSDKIITSVTLVDPETHLSVDVNNINPSPLKGTSHETDSR